MEVRGGRGKRNAGAVVPGWPEEAVMNHWFLRRFPEGTLALFG